MPAVLIGFAWGANAGAERPAGDGGPTVERRSGDGQLDEPQTDGRPTVAIVRFDAPVADEWWLTRGDPLARDLFAAELSAVGFEVLDRQQLDQMAVAEGLIVIGELTPAEAVKVGRILGVDYVVGGAVTEYQPIIPGLLKRGVGKLPGIGGDRHVFVAEFGARMWEATRGRMLWADRARTVTDLSRERALALEAGDGDPETTFREALQPVLEQLAGQLAGQSAAQLTADTPAGLTPAVTDPGRL